MSKRIKNKVGRPKLADTKLKRESLIIVAFILVVVSIICFLSYKSFTLQIKPNLYKANVLNTAINQCELKNNGLYCGTNVVYLKYGDKEIYKENENISIRNVDYDINFCYKVLNDDKLICIK